MTSAISIIIPTRNEEENIRRQAAALARTECQVIVVDGGSRDATREQARAAGFTVLTCEPGRARQLNCGAAAAAGDILLFLHADTTLPANFATDIREALAGRTCIAGAFRLAIEEPTPAMRLIAAGANLRSRLLGLPYGDQAIFTRRTSFEELGGFSETAIMEDFLFVRQAAKKGGICLLDSAVTTSSRRWRRQGVFRTTLINQLVVAGYYLGVSPERLRSLYDR